MLTRSGAQPGPAGISNIRHSLADASPGRNFVILYLLAMLLLTHCITAAFSEDRESPTRVAGLPLRSYRPEAHGVIAAGACGPVFLALVVLQQKLRFRSAQFPQSR
jgi:hypothetical protein